MTTTPSTDPALWEIRRRFGPAGGPDEIVLSAEGEARAFSVGAGVRRGRPTEALEKLALVGGHGPLSTRVPGSARIHRTDLGRFDQGAWGVLRALGYVESYTDGGGEDAVRLTRAGETAVQYGLQERVYLLDRCRRAAIAEATAE